MPQTHTTKQSPQPNLFNVNLANFRQNPDWDPNKIVVPGYDQTGGASRTQDSVNLSPEARAQESQHEKDTNTPTLIDELKNLLRW